MRSQVQPNPPSYVTLRDYLRLIGRQKWLIAAITLIFGAAAFVHSASREDTYTAQASLAFRDVVQDLALLGDAAVPELTPGERAAANAEAITSLATAAAVRERLGTQIAADELRDAISTRVDTLTSLVLVDAEWETPQFAARLANGFAFEAVATVSRQQRQVVEDAIEVLEDRLDEDPGASRTRQQLVRLETIRSILRPARVVRQAEPPAEPSGPATRRNTALGLLVGLALGLLAAFVRDSLDRRLRGSQDVRRELDLPVLGRLPVSAVGDASPSGNGHAGLSRGGFEAFRVLRNNLQFLKPDGELRSILITSSLPEEGKSTTAVSLASVSALAGRRTLLVECDLRRPSLAGRIGIKQTPGLRQYLNGEASPQEILQVVSLAFPTRNGEGEEPARRSDLICIAAGGSSEDSAELLASERFREFLEKVTSAYELVVIDAGPVLSAVDPLQLVPLVDGVVLCVRLAKTTRDDARAARAALARLPERPIGVVLTGDRGDDDYYGYYADEA
jgi:capsular exopolysaccharide synthesis family protein